MHESGGVSVEAPEFDRRGTDCVRATWRNVAIAVWRRETRVPDILALSALVSRLAEEHPEGVGLLQIIEVSAVIPASDARDALATMLRGGSRHVRGSAVVHLGTGFQASAVRAIVTGLSMIVRHPFPHEVRASVSEASFLLATHLARLSERASFSHRLEAAAESVRRD